MPPLMQMLSAISANSLVWSENFESDFGETFLIQLLKCDASSRLFGMNAVSEFVGQLEILISTANSSTEPLKQILTIRGMFRVIELAPQHLWINHLRNIIDFSKKAIRCVLIECDIFICIYIIFAYLCSSSVPQQVMQQKQLRRNIVTFNLYVRLPNFSFPSISVR